MSWELMGGKISQVAERIFWCNITHLDHCPSLLLPNFCLTIFYRLLSIKLSFVSCQNFTQTPCAVFKFGTIFMKHLNTIHFVRHFNGVPNETLALSTLNACDQLCVQFYEKERCLSFYSTLSTSMIVFDNNPSLSIVTCVVSVIRYFKSNYI